MPISISLLQVKSNFLLTWPGSFSIISVFGVSEYSSPKRSITNIKACLIIIANLLTLSAPAFSASLISVPLDHFSYQFIERLQAKGILGEYISNSKPYSRGEMAEMIAQTARLIEDGSISLTPVEIELLEEMKKEFSQELAELGMPGIKKHKHLLDWEDVERKLITSIGFDQDSSFIMGTDGINISTLKFTFYGDMLKNLSFYSYSRLTRTNQNPPLSKQDKDPRYLSYRCIGAGCANALSDAYIVYGNPQINIQAGKDVIRWGPGYHGVIGLSGNELAFDTVKLRANIWKLDCISLLGFLRDDLTKKYTSDVPKKYLSAHRFELTPFPGLCIAWQEAYIYAEHLHIMLMSPVMLYQIWDYIDDTGNNTMEGDFEITLIPHTKLYGALFFDDFHIDTNPFKDPGFGWSVLGGAMVVDPFGLKNTHVILEYARVEPWTYTYKGIIQNPPIPTTYKHFGEPLGHWIGPNADDLYTQMGWQISKYIQGNISYNRIRHGEIGGNMDNYYSSDIKEKEFLGGIVESNQAIGLKLKYTTFHKLNISAGYRYIWIENKQKEEVRLPMSDNRKQEWKPGWNTKENELSISIQIRY